MILHYHDSNGDFVEAVDTTFGVMVERTALRGDIDIATCRRLNLGVPVETSDPDGADIIAYHWEYSDNGESEMPTSVMVIDGTRTAPVAVHPVLREFERHPRLEALIGQFIAAKAAAAADGINSDGTSISEIASNILASEGVTDIVKLRHGSIISAIWDDIASHAFSGDKSRAWEWFTGVYLPYIQPPGEGENL